MRHVTLILLVGFLLGCYACDDEGAWYPDGDSSTDSPYDPGYDIGTDTPIDTAGDPPMDPGSDPSGRNYCLHYAGDRSFVEVPNDAQFNLGEQWTVEAWVNTESDTVAQYIVSYVSTGAPVYEIHCGDRVGGSYYSTVIHGSYDVGNPMATSTGEWHHIALVKELDYLRVFYDGFEMDAEPNSGYPVPSEYAELQFGWSPGGFDSLVGMIDEVRISSVPRYTANFTPETRFEPDSVTIVLFHFDEGSGPVTRDEIAGFEGNIRTGVTWVER